MEKARKRLRFEIGLAIISCLLFFVTLVSNEGRWRVYRREKR